VEEWEKSRKRKTSGMKTTDRKGVGLLNEGKKKNNMGDTHKASCRSLGYVQNGQLPWTGGGSGKKPPDGTDKRSSSKRTKVKEKSHAKMRRNNSSEINAYAKMGREVEIVFGVKTGPDGWVLEAEVSREVG